MSTKGERVGWIFYPSFDDAFDTLSDAEELELFRALRHYGRTGTQPVFSSKMLEGYFKLMQPNIDQSIKKRKDALKGGRPPSNKTPSEDAEKESEPQQNENENQWFKPVVETEKSEKRMVEMASKNRSFFIMAASHRFRCASRREQADC